MWPSTVAPSSGRAWRVAQLVAVAGGAVLVAGFIWRPELSLALWWNLAVPMVLASLLVVPHLWRNLCPVATISMWPNGWLGRRVPSARAMQAAGALGIVVLLLMVPLRRLALNEDGGALAIAIGAGVAVAFALGAWFDLKSGFCNAMCPLLPVERLLGQAPLVELENPRCDGCQLCSARGCLDLAPSLAVTHTLGASRRSHGWLLTPFGGFTAAYPGLIAGYFLAENTSWSEAFPVYGSVLAWMAISYVVVAVLARTARLDAARVLPVLAAVAAALYFWFALPGGLALVGADAALPVVRATAILAIAAWWWRAR